MRNFKGKIKSEDELYKIVYFIRNTFKDDSTRLRASFIWITENISYDVRAFQEDDQTAGLISYAIKNKKAICGGYALLLKYFCDAFEIENEIVSGFGRANKNHVVLNQTLLRSNHAWNAVKINGSWRLIDPTWAAGYVDDTYENNLKYKKSFSEFYYFTPPERFVLNHFPSQPRFQFLKKNVLEKDFKSLPLITTMYASDGISKLFPDSSFIKTKVGDTLRIKFENMDHTGAICGWTDKIKKAYYSGPVIRKDNGCEFYYPVTVSGLYNLYVGYCFNNNFYPLVIYKLQAN